MFSLYFDYLYFSLFPGLVLSGDLGSDCSSSELVIAYFLLLIVFDIVHKTKFGIIVRRSFQFFFFTAGKYFLPRIIN